MLAELLGWTYLEDDESGEYVLEPRRPVTTPTHR
jgi:hypothetical protein